MPPRSRKYPRRSPAPPSFDRKEPTLRTRTWFSNYPRSKLTQPDIWVATIPHLWYSSFGFALVSYLCFLKKSTQVSQPRGSKFLESRMAFGGYGVVQYLRYQGTLSALGKNCLGGGCASKVRRTRTRCRRPGSLRRTEDRPSSLRHSQPLSDVARSKPRWWTSARIFCLASGVYLGPPARCQLFPLLVGKPGLPGAYQVAGRPSGELRWWLSGLGSARKKEEKKRRRTQKHTSAAFSREK